MSLVEKRSDWVEPRLLTARRNVFASVPKEYDEEEVPCGTANVDEEAADLLPFDTEDLLTRCLGKSTCCRSVRSDSGLPKGVLPPGSRLSSLRSLSAESRVAAFHRTSRRELRR